MLHRMCDGALRGFSRGRRFGFQQGHRSSSGSVRTEVDRRKLSSHTALGQGARRSMRLQRPRPGGSGPLTVPGVGRWPAAPFADSDNIHFFCRNMVGPDGPVLMNFETSRAPPARCRRFGKSLGDPSGFGDGDPGVDRPSSGCWPPGGVPAEGPAERVLAVADRFGPPEGDPPTVPAYQRDRLLGHVYLNSDFTNSVGYSGKPINLLVGIDPNGLITKIKLVDHKGADRPHRYPRAAHRGCHERARREGHEGDCDRGRAPAATGHCQRCYRDGARHGRQRRAFRGASHPKRSARRCGSRRRRAPRPGVDLTNRKPAIGSRS